MYTTAANSEGFSIATRLKEEAPTFYGAGSYIRADNTIGIVANVRIGGDPLIDILAASAPGTLPQEVILDNRANRGGVVFFDCLIVGSFIPGEISPYCHPMPPLALSAAYLIEPEHITKRPLSFHYAHMFRRPQYYGRDTWAIWADHCNHLLNVWTFEIGELFQAEISAAYQDDYPFLVNFSALIIE